MKWTGSGEDKILSIGKGEDKQDAVRFLIVSLMEKVKEENINDWDLLILDMWIDNLGRLIGFVQDSKEPIGRDLGFRYALKFEEYRDKLERAEENNIYQVLDDIEDDLMWEIIDAINEPQFYKSISDKFPNKSWTIETTNRGERINRILTVNS